jgi:hypothetical protein
MALFGVRRKKAMVLFLHWDRRTAQSTRKDQGPCVGVLDPQFWVGCASDVMPVALYIETKFCIGYNLPCRLYTSIEPNNSKKIYYKWASTCAKFCPRVDQLLRMMCLFKLKTFVKTDYVLCLMQCGAPSLVEMGLGCSQLQKSMC